jgi:lysophospholipid acyltransferase (LPLAT)-like uncharacterized protein
LDLEVAPMQRLLKYDATLWLMAKLVRLWHRTMRVRIEYADPSVCPFETDKGNLYCFWHEALIPGASIFANANINVLVSESRDGEYIARVIEKLGFQTVRGSTSRGGTKALRELLRTVADHNLAITPDGPRGPRHKFQPGAVFLGSRTQTRLVPIGFAFGRAWRAKSWDQTIFPKLFTRAVAYFGPPITVPSKARQDTLSEYQELAGRAIIEATRAAEGVAFPGLRDTNRRLRTVGRLSRYAPTAALPNSPSGICSWLAIF